MHSCIMIAHESYLRTVEEKNTIGTLVVGLDSRVNLDGGKPFRVGDSVIDIEYSHEVQHRSW